jgi:hypothetical protein
MINTQSMISNSPMIADFTKLISSVFTVDKRVVAG